MDVFQPTYSVMMKNSRLIPLFFSCALVILQGCTALHVPHSEIALIDHPGDRDFVKRGTSLNSGLWNRGIQPYVIRTHHREGLVDNVAARHYYGISRTELIFANAKTALAFSLGSGAAGLDMTQKLFKNIYFTALGNGNYNFEGILQTPIYRTGKSGLSLGLFYRSDRHGLIARNCTNYFCINTKIGQYYRISALGLRINQYVDDRGGLMRFRFHAGYSPELKGIVFSIGVHSPHSK